MRKIIITLLIAVMLVPISISHYEEEIPTFVVDDKARVYVQGNEQIKDANYSLREMFSIMDYSNIDRMFYILSLIGADDIDEVNCVTDSYQEYCECWTKQNEYIFVNENGYFEYVSNNNDEAYNVLKTYIDEYGQNMKYNVKNRIHHVEEFLSILGMEIGEIEYCRNFSSVDLKSINDESMGCETNVKNGSYLRIALKINDMEFYSRDFLSNIDGMIYYGIYMDFYVTDSGVEYAQTNVGGNLIGVYCGDEVRCISIDEAIEILMSYYEKQYILTDVEFNAPELVLIPSYDDSISTTIYVPAWIFSSKSTSDNIVINAIDGYIVN